MELRQHTDSAGRCPFEDWFEALDPAAAAKVTIALTRLEQGNLSNTKSVGGGDLEYRIHSGPGYRIYFGIDGKRLIILLAGGSKKRQGNDIEAAKARWIEYSKRKKGLN